MSRLAIAGILLLTLVAARPAVAGEAHWETDLDKAVALAKQRDTIVFALFTGSDWCPPCKAFEAQTLSTRDFARYASKTLVLAKFDIPNGNFVTAKQKAYNKGLMGKYGVSGVPTVILFGPDGTEIKRQVGGQSMRDLERFCDSAIKMRKLKPKAAGDAPAGDANEDGVVVNEARVWTDTRGRTVEATLVRVKTNSIVMRTKDGKEYDVPLSQLSDEDVAYVKNNR